METNAVGDRRVGFVGLGAMGVPMAANLLAAGVRLSGYARTPEKAAELVASGLELRATPAEAVEAITFVSLRDDAALLAMVEGPSGIAAGCEQGAIVVDTSTVHPSTSARVAELLAERGASLLRTPVSGSTAVARAGQLGILCSGPPEAFAACSELLGAIGKPPHYLGEAEQARYAKLALNLMVVVSMQAISESLVLAEAAGIDRGAMLEVMASSAVGSPFVSYKAPPLLADDYSPTFSVEGMREDLRILFDVSDELRAPVRTATVVDELLETCEANGWGGLDFAALYLLQRRLVGREVEIAQGEEC